MKVRVGPAVWVVTRISRPPSSKRRERPRIEQRKVTVAHGCGAKTADIPERQRAFRERKERHVQALKEQLNSTTVKMKTIETDFERLQRENERLATQNEILRATSKPQSYSHPQASPPEREISPIPGPQRYSPSSTFRANLMSTLPPHHHHPPPHQPDGPRINPVRGTSAYRLDVSATTGQKLLSMSAAWETVQNHNLYKRGQINIHELCEKMKGFSTCNGQGPAFPEDALLKAIEESVGGAGDELL